MKEDTKILAETGRQDINFIREIRAGIEINMGL
jgi:hypothetical protein